MQASCNLYPKSVIRQTVSVPDWENEASGHLASFCPHPVSRYAFGQARSMLHDTSGQSPQSLMTDWGLSKAGGPAETKREQDTAERAASPP